MSMKEALTNAIWDPILSGLLMECKDGRKKSEYVCVVEGKIDPFFYQNYKNSPLKNKNVTFVNSINDNVKPKYLGKDKVVRLFTIVSKNSTENKHLDKYIFIVDRDYDALKTKDYFSEFGLQSKDLAKITMTKPYAIENYFCSDKNLKKIFSLWNKSKELDAFNKEFSKFLFETDEYNMLHCTIIVCGKNQVKDILKSKTEDAEPVDIFKFDFNSKDVYRKDLLAKKVERLKEAKNSTSTTKKYYLSKASKISKNVDYYNGHNIYNFLEKYLMQKYNIDIHPMKNNKAYEYTLKQIDVDIDIKNALGEKIKETNYMKKNILILTSSAKNGGYCVAGIELETKKWIRLVNSSDPKHNEIPRNYMLYEDGTKCEPLDVVKVQFKKHMPGKIQKENWLIDSKPFKFERKVDITEVLEYANDEDFIYLNTKDRLKGNEISQINSTLGLYVVDNICIKKNDFKKFKATFTYKNKTYYQWSMTDTEFFGYDERVQYAKAAIVVSLPEVGYKMSETSSEDYYKFVSKIFPLEEE